jgi:hypothetical protein
VAIFDRMPPDMYRTGMCLLLSCMMKNVLAQVPSTSVWATLQLPVSLSKRWQLHNETSYRTLGISATANQRLYRG